MYLHAAELTQYKVGKGKNSLIVLTTANFGSQLQNMLNELNEYSEGTPHCPEIRAVKMSLVLLLLFACCCYIVYCCRRRHRCLLNGSAKNI